METCTTQRPCLTPLVFGEEHAVVVDIQGIKTTIFIARIERIAVGLWFITGGNVTCQHKQWVGWGEGAEVEGAIADVAKGGKATACPTI